MRSSDLVDWVRFTLIGRSTVATFLREPFSTLVVFSLQMDRCIKVAWSEVYFGSGGYTTPPIKILPLCYLLISTSSKFKMNCRAMLSSIFILISAQNRLIAALVSRGKLYTRLSKIWKHITFYSLLEAKNTKIFNMRDPIIQNTENLRI